MAKSLDQVKTEEVMEEGQGEKFSADDVEIATRMTIQMLSEGDGLQVISDAVNQSQDPAQVIGQFLAQIFGQLAEQLAAEANVDPRVFLAENGVLDNVLEYIEKKLGYPDEFSDEVYGQVMEAIKAAASQPPAPNDVTGEEADPNQMQLPEGEQPPMQPMGGM